MSRPVLAEPAASGPSGAGAKKPVLRAEPAASGPSGAELGKPMRKPKNKVNDQFRRDTPAGSATPTKLDDPTTVSSGARCR